MSLLILLTGVAMGATAAALLRERIERTLPASLMAAVLVMYLFGITNRLVWGLNTVLLALVFGMVAATVRVLRERRVRDTLQLIATPGLLIWIVLGLILRQHFRLLRLSAWDEFSHWGTVAKVTYAQDALSPFHEPSLYFVTYPPGAAIWQYFCSNILGALRS